MSTEITIVKEITEDQAPQIFGHNTLNDYVESAREKVKGLAFDMTIKKDREALRSLAAKIPKSKKAVENVGRAYNKKLKAESNAIDKEIREFVRAMDELRDETRAPLTAYEEEEKRKEAEAIAKAEAEKLAAQIASDYEIAVLMNNEFDRVEAEKKAEAKRIEAERIEKIKAEAAQKAKEDAEREADRQKAEAEQKIIDAKLAEQAAKKQAEQAILREEEQKRLAKQQAEREKILAKQRQEQAVKAEAERIENLRLQEIEKERIRTQNKDHRRAINIEVMQSLVDTLGYTETQAKDLITAIAKGQIKHLNIIY